MSVEKPEKRFGSDPRYGDYRDGDDKWENNPADGHGVMRDLIDDLQEVGIHFDEKPKILEIGSGNGNVVKAAKAEGYDIIGVDARPRHAGQLPVAAARIEQLPFAAETFDIVRSRGVFGMTIYDQDQELMVSEIIRVLKPGGVFDCGIFRPEKGFPLKLSPVMLRTVMVEGREIFQKIV